MPSNCPNLKQAGGAYAPPYLHGQHPQAVRRLCRAVYARTGERAWFDVPRTELCFGHTLPSDPTPRIVLSIPLFRDFERTSPIHYDPSRDCWDQDTICRFIRYSRVSAEQKSAWRGMRAKTRESDERQAQGEAAERSIKPAMQATERAYERHSMGRHYHKRASVDGLRSL